MYTEICPNRLWAAGIPLLSRTSVPCNHASRCCVDQHARWSCSRPVALPQYTNIMHMVTSSVQTPSYEAIWLYKSLSPSLSAFKPPLRIPSLHLSFYQTPYSCIPSSTSSRVAPSFSRCKRSASSPPFHPPTMVTATRPSQRRHLGSRRPRCPRLNTCQRCRWWKRPM
jgi:hypothetical protein